MNPRLSDYREILGSEALEELALLAARVSDRRLQNITYSGEGRGTPEMLKRLLPLLTELGVETSWTEMKGTEDFRAALREIHDGLQGAPGPLSRSARETYEAVTEANLASMEFGDDSILVHDPAPAGLIAARAEHGRHWAWRCHLDLNAPEESVWGYLLPTLERYDALIFSLPGFARRLRPPQYMMAPSIDPLSEKNRELSEQEVAKVLADSGVDEKRPVLIQVARFARPKDPLGAIEIYRRVRSAHDCQLVLAGDPVEDDPEAVRLLREVTERAADDADIHVLSLPPGSDLQINALVRGSTVVLQNSIREGFGLTAAEALWKKKPVVATAVGGLKLQVIDGFTGFLFHSPERAVARIGELLDDPALCRRLGENGYQHVKQNYLITRHLKDALLLMLAADHLEESIVYLDGVGR